MGRHKEFDQDVAVDKAMELFWTRGYEAVSVQDLCSGLGINRGSLYDTFGDKLELFLICLDRFRDRMDEELYYILKEETDSPKEQLGRFFAKVIGISLNNASLHRGCLMANTTLGPAAYEPQVASRVDAYSLNVETLLFQLLMRAQKNRRLKSKHTPRELARFLLNTKQGLHVLSRTCSDRTVLDDAVKVALSLIE